MGVELLTERHSSETARVLGCYHRRLISDTLRGICYTGGMTSFLYARQIRVFDYPKFAEPFCERIRDNAEQMAAAAGVEIEFIRTRKIRKEDRTQELLAKRGEHPGTGLHPLGHGALLDVQAMAQQTKRPDVSCAHEGKCLHYYFYFVDENSASVTCGYRQGCPAACISASTATTGWPTSCARLGSKIESPVYTLLKPKI